MKYLSMIAAISLALSSTLAAAQSAGNANQRPAPGPVAGHPVESTIPAAAVAIGGLVFFGGLAVILLGSSDSNNKTNNPPRAK